jgi:hypothetical protein
MRRSPLPPLGPMQVDGQPAIVSLIPEASDVHPDDLPEELRAMLLRLQSPGGTCCGDGSLEGHDDRSDD